MTANLLATKVISPSIRASINNNPSSLARFTVYAFVKRIFIELVVYNKPHNITQRLHGQGGGRILGGRFDTPQLFKKFYESQSQKMLVTCLVPQHSLYQMIEVFHRFSAYFLSIIKMKHVV